ncbi:MAG: hypothetical protein M9962_15205 [Oligoflexia bacterium]|nr:hypothetical protein [Oligoflexia bacterium]
MFRLSFFAASAAFVSINAFATMTPGYERGESLVWFNIPGKASEVCVIPKHLPGAKFSKKDLKREQELCSLEVGVNIAACPKINSSNPGVDFYLPPKGMSLEELTRKDCQVEGAKKEAKYKLSTSCSYTPSIVAYYHLSRILGDVANVPPVVLRTMDLDRHIVLGRRALEITKSGSLINQTWSGLYSALVAGSGSKRKDLLFTDNFDQSYGALSRNPKGEEFYKEMFNGGTNREETFKAKNVIYRALTNPATKVGTEFNQKNVQSMQQLKDAGEMIILDTILGQQDRFGNIHAEIKYFYLENKDGKISVESNDKLDEIPEQYRSMAVKAKELVLKDNDCGVAKEHRVKAAGLHKEISHIDPKTYKRVLELNKVADSEETKRYFTKGMLFTEADWKKVRQNLSEVAALLQDRCRAGKLKLDLNLDEHFGGLKKDYSCEI